MDSRAIRSAAVVAILTAALPTSQLLLNAVGYSIPQGSKSNSDVLPIVEEVIHNDPNRLQFVGYVAIVVALLTLALWLSRREFDHHEVARGFNIGFAMTTAVLIYPLIRVEPAFAIGGAISAVCYVIVINLDLGRSRRLVGIVAVAAVAVLVVALRFVVPLLRPTQTRGTINGVGNVSTHYFLTLMNGQDLVCCGGAFGVLDAPYGFLMAIASAPLFLIFGFIEAVDRPIAVIFATQIAVIVLLVVAMRRVAPSRWALSSLAFVLVAPFVTLVTPLTAPNLTSIRYVPIVVALVAISRHLCHPPSGWSEVRLLALGSMLFALAPDTGFVALLGVVLFTSVSTTAQLGVRTLLTRTLQRLAASGALAAAIMIGLSGVLLRESDSRPGLDFVFSYAGGFGGLVVRWTPLAALMLLLLVPGLLASMAALSRVEFRSDAAFQLSLSAMGIVWIATFQNRMTNLNIWFVSVLLVFAYSRMFESDRDSLLARWLRGRIPRTILVLAVGGQSLVSLINAVPAALSTSAEDCVQVADVIDRRCIDLEEAALVRAHFELPKGIENKDEWLVCSPFSSEMLLLGLNDSGRLRICMFERLTQLESAIDYLKGEGPRFVAIPDTNDPIRQSSPVFDWTMEFILRDLPEYQARDRIDGWVVYERMP